MLHLALQREGRRDTDVVGSTLKGLVLHGGQSGHVGMWIQSSLWRLHLQFGCGPLRLYCRRQLAWRLATPWRISASALAHPPTSLLPRCRASYIRCQCSIFNSRRQRGGTHRKQACSPQLITSPWDRAWARSPCRAAQRRAGQGRGEGAGGEAFQEGAGTAAGAGRQAPAGERQSAL